jgi:hypothetical protein
MWIILSLAIAGISWYKFGNQKRPVKSCSNCVFSKSDMAGDEYMRCRAPQNEKPSPVSAKLTVYRFDYCSTHRMDRLLGSYMVGTCGKRAHWYQPKISRAVPIEK